jgi:hypothetical protein
VGHGVAYVEVKADEVTIDFTEADDTDIGAATRLADLCASRRRRLYVDLMPAVFMLLGVPFLLGTVGWMLWQAFQTRTLTLVLVYSAMLSMALAGSARLAVLIRGKEIRFRPERGERKPVNWRGVWWDIGKIVIGAAAGGLVGYLIGKK